VIFFNTALAVDFDYRCKQAGQLASKMRFLSAPWVNMLQSGAWLRNAEHANRCAKEFAQSLENIPAVELMFPVEANGVFLVLSEDVQQSLRAKGWTFYTFIGGGARFMFSWDANPIRVKELIEDLKNAMFALST